MARSPSTNVKRGAEIFTGEYELMQENSVVGWVWVNNSMTTEYWAIVDSSYSAPGNDPVTDVTFQSMDTEVSYATLSAFLDTCCTRADPFAILVGWTHSVSPPTVRRC